MVSVLREPDDFVFSAQALVRPGCRAAAPLGLYEVELEADQFDQPLFVTPEAGSSVAAARISLRTRASAAATAR